MEVPNRRPIKTRSAAWAGASASALARAGFTPNRVSVIGIVFALAGAAAFAISHHHTGWNAAVLLIAGTIAIQLRLVCNLLDGLIAIENGLKSKLGDVFNEAPDRLEDTGLFLGAGLAINTDWGLTLGWVASLLAVGTAYVRLLGGSLGLKQDFCGPFAKQQRMFFLTVAALGAALEALVSDSHWSLACGLALIVVGTTVTLIRRFVRLAHALQSR